MMPHFQRYAVLLAGLLMPAAANATAPKLGADTCTQLRLEETKFRQSGLLDDMSKGAEWAKTNLSQDRLHEIERFITLDEQIKFGCRDAKVSADAEKASEAAGRIEVNSDADPTKPVVKDPKKPGAKPTSGKHTSHKKTNSAAPKAENIDLKQKDAKAETPEKPSAAPAAAESSATSEASVPNEADTPAVSAFGFGETMILPHPSGN
jgi:hypothetical protein